MPDIVDIPTVRDGDLIKLCGPVNYSQWAKNFKWLALLNGYKGLYLGTEPVVEKPDPSGCLPREAAPKCTTSLSAEKSDNEMAANEPDDVSEFLADQTVRVVLYKFRLQKWEDYNKDLDSACALLRASVKPWIWQAIPATDTAHPETSWNAIAAANKLPDDIQVQRMMAELDTISITDPCDLDRFLGHLEDVYRDVRDANGFYPHSLMVSRINAALPQEYDTFINFWRFESYNKPVDEARLEEYRRRLRGYASRNHDEWKEAQRHKAQRKGNKIKAKATPKDVSDNAPGNRRKCGHCSCFGHPITTCRYAGRPETSQCVVCHKLGHTQRNCRRKLGSRNKANAAVFRDNPDVPNGNSDFDMGHVALTVFELRF
ncbi:hypothetical protein NX059_009076 [Plenodomus lindquistii]|nr:hypothetical protein NX059_009076 [Plenodomus lindquistii]